MRRPRPALIVTALSALVLMSVPFGVAVAGSNASAPVEQAGDRSPFAREAAPPASASPADPSLAFPRVEQVVDVPQPVPVSLSIPRLDVRAEIDQVGVESDGWVEIPEDVARVGWYRFGAAPGAASGSAVIVGHRDGWNVGAGALYDLAQVEPGDDIVVEREDGSAIAYRVVSREAIDKADLPTDELFSEAGDPRLTLISCIGYFDRDNGGYLQNIVVTAVPLTASLGAVVGS